MPQTHYIRWVPAPNMIKRIGRIHTLLYRATAGRLGARVDGLDVLLLTTTGKKTGIARTVPLPYFRVGTQLALVASYGGNRNHPAWYANLLANQRVQIQLGARRWSTQVQIPAAPERDRLWQAITHEFPRYLAYQDKTTRTIPVVVIEGPA